MCGVPKLLILKKMTCNDFQLSAHWLQLTHKEDKFFCDDGRDYDQPMYQRFDGLARIYQNDDIYDGPLDKLYTFVILYGKGEDEEFLGHAETLAEAIFMADKRVTRLLLNNGI